MKNVALPPAAWVFLCKLHTKVHEQIPRDWWGQHKEEIIETIDEGYDYWADGLWLNEEDRWLIWP